MAKRNELKGWKVGEIVMVSDVRKFKIVGFPNRRSALVRMLGGRDEDAFQVDLVDLRKYDGEVRTE